MSGLNWLIWLPRLGWLNQLLLGISHFLVVGIPLTFIIGLFGLNWIHTQPWSRWVCKCLNGSIYLSWMVKQCCSVYEDSVANTVPSPTMEIIFTVDSASRFPPSHHSWVSLAIWLSGLTTGTAVDYRLSYWFESTLTPLGLSLIVVAGSILKLPLGLSISIIRMHL